MEKPVFDTNFRMKHDPLWRKFRDSPDDSATTTYGIAYDSPDGQHILCGKMYLWQADWLLSILDKCDSIPMPR